jgi:uncharacterized protein YjbJ (UPF0337 family)
MVQLYPVEILKRHGLYTDEVRTRLGMIDAVMKKRWDDPVLRDNLTREQIEQMKSQPPVQSGGALSIPSGFLDKAKELTSMPAAKEIASEAVDFSKITGANPLKGNLGDLKGMAGNLGDLKGMAGNLGDLKGMAEGKAQGLMSKVTNFKDMAEGKVGSLMSKATNFKDMAEGRLDAAKGKLDGLKSSFGDLKNMASGKFDSPLSAADDSPEAMERRQAVSAKIGEFADKVPGVGYVKNKLPGQIVKGLGNTLNINKSDGFLTMVVKWFLNLISTIIGSPLWPTYIRALFGINFILAYAQTMPIFGGLIQAALEMTTFVITTTGTTILSLGNMGGPVGHIIGLMFASIFFILSALISYSRQQFTDALIVSANLIPFVGMPISAALQRADIAASKLTEAAKKVHNSFLDLVAAVFDIKGKVHTGGIRFSRRRKNTKKWRTRRSRFGRL